MVSRALRNKLARDMGVPSDSNIGQSGVDSIRLDGKRIEDLPLGQGNEAKEGLQEFLKTDKQNRIDNIKSKYPTQTVAYLRAAIKECKENIERTKKLKTDLKGKIAEYRQLMEDCNYRDREMERLDKENEDDRAEIKGLRLKYPPYDIAAMRQQIVQFDEGMDRCDLVIEKDQASIVEVSNVLTLAERRDRELSKVK